MNTQASLPMPLFDAFLPTTQPIFADHYSNQHKPTPSEPLALAQGETLLSMAKLHERLTLLAQLELPCTILITNPPLHLRDAVIKAVELGSESLVIAGADFNLRLRGPNIHSIRLVNPREAGDGTASLDIHHSHGMLYASIRPAPDGVGSEVWRDVMENPSLALV